MSAVASTARQARAFAAAHARELARDRSAVIAMVVSFAALLGVLWAVELLVSRASGEQERILAGSLGTVGMAGALGIALAATAVPIVRYRSLGTLRHLATTPARPTAFLLGHAPARVLVVGAESAIIGAIALLHGTPLPEAWQLAITLVLGGTAILALGYLLAARMRSPDAMLQLAYLLPLLVLATSGALIPLRALPGIVEAVCRAMPQAWYLDTLNALVAGSAPPLPLGLVWAVLALAAVCSAILAPRLHRWA